MGISKLLVFLIGIHFSSEKIYTIDVDYNDLASDIADIQFEWSSEDKGDQIKIEEPGRLSYVGLSKVYNLIRTTKPIPQKNWTSFYFEAKIVKAGNNDIIAIGLTEADPNTRTNCLPGWNTDKWQIHSYSTLGIGVHGDNGGIYHGSGRAIDYFESFTTGDVVGCLVRNNNIDRTHQENTTVVFTKNGNTWTSPIRIKDGVWYPTIGIASIGAAVETNFGEHPFLYSDMNKPENGLNDKENGPETGLDSEKTCQDQPEQSQPCIRETIEGCKTCTHWTYINKCIAVSGEGECSLYNFDSTTGHCKNAGGWRCYEPIDDNSGVKLPSSDYKLIGDGWCRPECHLLRNVRPSTCRLNARKKDYSNPDECEAACDNEEGCTGFAISDGSFFYPNRCYIYGNFSSTNQGVTSSWIAKPHSFIEVNSTNGNHGVKCWKKTKGMAKFEYDYIIGKKGTLCQTGIIQDEVECKNAVRSFGNITIDNAHMFEDGSWVENKSIFPKGCYIWNMISDKKSVFFNKANSSEICSECIPICHQGPQEKNNDNIDIYEGSGYPSYINSDDYYDKEINIDNESDDANGDRDFDDDGIPDDLDDDDDNDGIPDILDTDDDNDGIPDDLDDLDDDNDGIPDILDTDDDNDGIPDYLDDDDDNDGIPDILDTDDGIDGIPDDLDDDDDNDGIPDILDTDSDYDGIPDDLDDDDDDYEEMFDNDTDGDGIPDTDDPDIDGDGILNVNDEYDDGDGIGDEDDLPVGEGCIDKDHGVYDSFGDSCTWYNGLHVSRLPYNCGNHDDDDFKANIMCCACKDISTTIATPASTAKVITGTAPNITKDLWIEEAPGKYCISTRTGYDSWGDLVKDQASCQAQCELDSQCIGIAYSHENPFQDWCYICLDDELGLDILNIGFGFYRRLGISTSAPTTTAQSTNPEYYEYEEYDEYEEYENHAQSSTTPFRTTQSTTSVSIDEEWESIDCGGIDIDGNGEKGLTKKECKDKCDSDPECSFVVHGGPGGARGSSYDWWANRCVPRKHLSLPCPISTWMQTYIKKGNKMDHVATAKTTISTTTSSILKLDITEAKRACQNFGNDWRVDHTTDRALVCTKKGTSWVHNCDSCSIWRMLVWADGGFEHDKGDARQPDDPSTVAGKYYGGHEPCDYGNNYPLCGDWISTRNYLWQEEVKDEYCPNFVPNHDVSSQQECQRRCVEKIGCVGISYSHKDNDHMRYCYVCMDDNLTTAYNDFGFYRKPVATEESLAKTTPLTTQVLLEPTTSDTNSVPQGCSDKLPTDYDKNRCGWTCADWSGKSFKGYSLAKNYCEDDWSQYQHCGTHIKGLIKDYCKISCDSCDSVAPATTPQPPKTTPPPRATTTDLEDNYNEIPVSLEDKKYLEDNYVEYSDWLDDSFLDNLQTSTESQEKKSQDINMFSTEVRIDPSCVDQKVWCKFADCSLENVKRNCQKTCNNCL